MFIYIYMQTLAVTLDYIANGQRLLTVNLKIVTKKGVTFLMVNFVQ